MVSKKLKRLLSLGIVCLMLTPIISFATTDDNKDTATDGDTTVEEGNGDNASDNGGNAGEVTGKHWIESLNSNANDAASANQEKVAEIKKFLMLPEAERQKLAVESAVVETSKEDIEGHSYVCTVAGLELYVKAANLSVIVRDEKSGAIIRSTMSGDEAVAKGYGQDMYLTVTSGVLVKPITYNDDNSTNRFGAYQDGILTGLQSDYATLEEYKEDGKVVGVTAHVDFKVYGFKFDIVYKLTEEGSFVYYVDGDSIEENNKGFMLAQMTVLPLFGYTDRGDREGYLLLPDGNGIIVENEDYFQDGKNKYKTQFQKKVYAADAGIDSSLAVTVGSSVTGLQGSRDFTNAAEELSVPYFGMVCTDTKIATVGIITQGEYGAEIFGNINGINRSFENYAFARFTYRQKYQEFVDKVGASETYLAPKERMIDDVEVEFAITTGDDATYSGLANKMRTVLQNKGILKENAKKDFDVRIDFIGVDKEDFLVFRRNVVATTADDIRDMLNALADKGVTNVVAVYEGWQKGGVYNLPIYDFKADGDIGGNSAVKELAEELKNGGKVQFYLMQDMVTINTSVASSVFTSLTAYTGKTFEWREPFNEVYTTFRYLYPTKSQEYINELVDEFLDNGITNAGFSGISNTLFVYEDGGEYYDRQDSIKNYTDALAKAKEKGMNIALKSPFMYLWKYTDAYLDLSMSSSMYVYASAEVPFLSSVLKGSMNIYSEYVNFEANSTEFFLKMVETGVLPSFLITKESPAVLQYTNSNWNYSSEYELYEELIAEYYEKLKAVNDKVAGEYIVNHEKTDSDVSITTYSNGVKVYVNFSDVDVTVDGMTIEAESYSVR